MTEENVVPNLSGSEVSRVHKNARYPGAFANPNFGNTRAAPFKVDADASERQIAKVSHTTGNAVTRVQMNVLEKMKDLWHSPVAITKSSGVSR
jgi:hypothetical protein